MDGCTASGPTNLFPKLVARNLPVEFGCPTADVRPDRVLTLRRHTLSSARRPEAGVLILAEAPEGVSATANSKKGGAALVQPIIVLLAKFLLFEDLQTTAIIPKKNRA